MYVDGSTLSRTLNAFKAEADTINVEVDKINMWLKVNALSINSKKSKFMIFHTPRKIIQIATIKINNTSIECVKQFDFLGTTLDEHMTWKNHTEKMSNTISRTIDILNRLKYVLPLNINTLIH